MLRLKAEADAADRAARLRVYSEQLAEYAVDKSNSAELLLQQAQVLSASLQMLLQQGGDANGGEQAAHSNGVPAAPLQQHKASVAELMQGLKLQLEQAALEAKHFAEQQRADVERSKRSSQQVRCSVLADHPSSGFWVGKQY